MALTLKLDRDITRFIDDETFPFKATVCIGEKRIVCSGVALAEHSHALEMKMREDNGMLLFEEMVDVPGSDEILLQCIRYLHGAPLELNFDNVEVILKFSSWYGISALFSSCLSWLDTELLFSESVEITLSGIMKLLKISNCLSYPDSTVLKDLAHKLVWVHRSEKFWTEMVHYVDDWITGFDLVRIIEQSPGTYGGNIVAKWISLSMENKNFVLSNSTLFHFQVLFSNEDKFSYFISLMSDDTTLSSKQVKTLLDIQKDYFKEKAVCTKQSFLSQLSENQRIQNDLHFACTAYGENTKNLQNRGVAETSSIGSSSGDGKVMSHTQPRPGHAETGGPEIHNSGQDDDEVLDFPFCPDKWYLEIHNLPQSISEEDLWNVFASEEGLESINIIVPENDYAILTFEDKVCAKKLLGSPRLFTLNGKTLELRSCPSADNRYNDADQRGSGSRQPSNDNRVLYIGNIPNLYDERELKQLFSGFGRVIDFAVPVSQSRSRAMFRYAFLTYENVSSATRLVKASRAKGYFYRENKLVIQFKKRD